MFESVMYQNIFSAKTTVLLTLYLKLTLEYQSLSHYME